MQENNTYVQKLIEVKAELEKCQHSKTLTSCYNCELLLRCELRKDYTKKVYDSMSQGKAGGFEF